MGGSFDCSSSCFARTANSSCSRLKFAWKASSGLTVISPVAALNATTSPGATASIMPAAPTRAGIPRLLAIILTCEVVPPFSVIKPLTKSRSKLAVSEGAKSSAMMTEGVFMSPKRLVDLPWMAASKRLPTSITSAARSRIYSSSMDSKILRSSMMVSCNADSAFCFASVMRLYTPSLIIKSLARARCPSKMALVAARMVKSSETELTALSKRNCSASTPAASATK